MCDNKSIFIYLIFYAKRSCIAILAMHYARGLIITTRPIVCYGANRSSEFVGIIAAVIVLVIVVAGPLMTT
jgi:hypothetical protein